MASMRAECPIVPRSTIDRRPIARRRRRRRHTARDAFERERDDRARDRARCATASNGRIDARGANERARVRDG